MTYDYAGFIGGYALLTEAPRVVRVRVAGPETARSDPSPRRSRQAQLQHPTSSAEPDALLVPTPTTGATPPAAPLPAARPPRAHARRREPSRWLSHLSRHFNRRCRPFERCQASQLG